MEPIVAAGLFDMLESLLGPRAQAAAASAMLRILDDAATELESSRVRLLIARDNLDNAERQLRNLLDGAEPCDVLPWIGKLASRVAE
jgi:hypothetical protein